MRSLKVKDSLEKKTICFFKRISRAYERFARPPPPAAGRPMTATAGPRCWPTGHLRLYGDTIAKRG